MNTRFEDKGDGTILDNESGLVWAKEDSWPVAQDWLNFQEALEFVDEMNKKDYLGYHDWRIPEKEEIVACNPFLIQQLKAIQPKVVVALGKPAASTLLGRSVPITKERGTWHDYEGFKLMLTLHPAYLLRAYTIENRKAVHDDMKKVLKELGR